MADRQRGTDLISPEQDRRLRRWGVRAWAVVGILLLAAMLYVGISTISAFVIPFVVAIVLGMIFEPVASLATRVMPKQLASVLVLLGLVVVAAIAIGVVVVGVVDQGPEIVDQFQRAFDRLREWLIERGAGLAEFDDIAEQLSAFLEDALPGLLAYVPSAFSGVSRFLLSTFIALFILYFVLAEWDALTAWVGSHLGVPADLGAGIVHDATRSFRDYFYALTLSSIPVAVAVGAAAWLMDLPLAFTIGLITFVTSYVPYLGALVSSVFALLIAFGAGGPFAALVVLIVILIAQNVVQPVIQRLLERSTLELHPIVSFGSTIIGSVLAGVSGATLSAPFVAMVLRVRRRVKAFQSGDSLVVEVDDPLAAESAASGTEPPGR